MNLSAWRVKQVLLFACKQIWHIRSCLCHEGTLFSPGTPQTWQHETVISCENWTRKAFSSLFLNTMYVKLCNLELYSLFVFNMKPLIITETEPLPRKGSGKNVMTSKLKWIKHFIQPKSIHFSNGDGSSQAPAILPQMPQILGFSSIFRDVSVHRILEWCV